MKKPLDIAVISDVHLGTSDCRTTELLDYLKSIDPETLIINGDFIDMRSFRKSSFPKEHTNVLRYILKMADRGMKVYYITGNHDDALRHYSPFDSGNIHLRDKLVLQLKGKRYWFFHGDIFDTLLQYSPIIAKFGGKGYDFLTSFNRFANKTRSFFSMPRMSFSKKVRNNDKNAREFEDTAINLAAQENYDYVVCGHIHRPQIRKENIADREVIYMNSGDWIENLTALEYSWGKWNIYEYDKADFPKMNARLQVHDEAVNTARQLSKAKIFEKVVGRREFQE